MRRGEHSTRANRCLLLGDNRTSPKLCRMSAIGPKRTCRKNAIDVAFGGKADILPGGVVEGLSLFLEPLAQKALQSDRSRLAILVIICLTSACFMPSAIVNTSSARHRQNSGLSVWAGI